MTHCPSISQQPPQTFLSLWRGGDSFGGSSDIWIRTAQSTVLWVPLNRIRNWTWTSDFQPEWEKNIWNSLEWIPFLPPTKENRWHQKDEQHPNSLCYCSESVKPERQRSMGGEGTFLVNYDTFTPCHFTSYLNSSDPTSSQLVPCSWPVLAECSCRTSLFLSFILLLITGLNSPRGYLYLLTPLPTCSFIGMNLIEQTWV